jgi:ribosomal protein S18 acetylase RimI-like enzyme
MGSRSALIHRTLSGKQILVTSADRWRNDWGVTDAEVQLRDQGNGSGPVCRKILATLPTWFGIAESVEDYVAVAGQSPTVIASNNGTDVGLVTVISHGPYSAEIYVMAVRPEHHRRGIGRKMLRHVEDSLSRSGVEFLQVETLSPSHPDEGYGRTRAFYFSCGFRPLEEFPHLWSPQNPAIQVVKVVVADDEASP